MIKKAVIFTIKLYQKTLSFDHGVFKGRYPIGYCKFTPTCSDYCIESIEKKGVIKGVILSLWRICRCNPWSSGGYDPVN